MSLQPYRRVLARPGVRSLLGVALWARMPAVAAPLTLTLHVVLDLDRGYAAAGLVSAAVTVGAAVGAPLLGRLIDRRGLRLILVITTVAEAVFWVVAPQLAYPLLMAAATLAGLLALPVFSVVRQSLAALVPAGERRQAYALDSMSVEISFMVGPAVAVLLVTTTSARVAMVAIGAGYALAGAALFLLNPPTRGDDEPVEVGRRIPRRQWLRPRLVVVLAAAAATTLVLAGTDVAVIAALRGVGQVEWTGLVLALWGACSLAGGFVYGVASRSVTPLTLVALLSLFTIPVGLFGGQWWWLALALVPAGALCAPSLAAAAEAVARLVPAGARGEAMGWHNSAMTAGLAIGAPLAGAVIDASAPAWGFAAIGAVGALVVLAALPVSRRARREPVAGDDPLPATAAAATR